jgi:hypothetical protein
MIRFGLLVRCLSGAFLMVGARAHANSVTDGLQVSVRVIRSCSVETSGTVTTIDCGRGTREAERAARTSAPVIRIVSPSSTPGTITINF